MLNTLVSWLPNHLHCTCKPCIKATFLTALSKSLPACPAMQIAEALAAATNAEKARMESQDNSDMTVVDTSFLHKE